MRPGILTLTTDFGADGPYVASMKGIVLGLAPGTILVDVSHEIRPQDIAGGSFVLASVVDCFPAGTVHLAVVDPGVGTARRIIAVEVDGQFFVLPDNGLITGVLSGRRPSSICEVRNPSFRRSNVSTTFHGRDILAPAAAHLLNGGRLNDLGPGVDDLVRLATAEPIEDGGGLVGEVDFVDSFGNLITNIFRDRLRSAPLASWSIEIHGQTIAGVVATYGQRTSGTLMALVGSSDRLEIAVVNGDAARTLGAGRGSSVRLRRHQESLA